jgi:hypothetical protein
MGSGGRRYDLSSYQERTVPHANILPPINTGVQAIKKELEDVKSELRINLAPDIQQKLIQLDPSIKSSPSEELPRLKA